MSEQFELRDKIRLVRLYSSNGSSVYAVRRFLYQEGKDVGTFSQTSRFNHPEVQKQLPHDTTIRRINETFDETGCVDKNLLKSGCEWL